MTSFLTKPPVQQLYIENDSGNLVDLRNTVTRTPEAVSFCFYFLNPHKSKQEQTNQIPSCARRLTIEIHLANSVETKGENTGYIVIFKFELKFFLHVKANISYSLFFHKRKIFCP